MNMFPNVQLIDKYLLQIDDVRYQRNTGMEDDIVENFNPDQYQPLDVNMRSDDTMWVVEGGNRLRAALRLPNVYSVWCVVHRLSLDDEVKLFHLLDEKRKDLTEKDKLKGKVTLNQTEAVLVSKLINQAKDKKIKTPENIKSYLNLAKRNSEIFERVWSITLDISPINKTIRKRVVRALFLLETNSNKGDKIWTESLLKFLKDEGAESINNLMLKTGVNVNTGSDDLQLDAIRTVLEMNKDKIK